MRKLAAIAAILGIGSPASAAPAPSIAPQTEQSGAEQAQRKQAPVAPPEQAKTRAQIRMAVHADKAPPVYFTIKQSIGTPPWALRGHGTHRRPNAHRKDIRRR